MTLSQPSSNFATALSQGCGDDALNGFHSYFGYAVTVEYAA